MARRSSRVFIKTEDCEIVNESKSIDIISLTVTKGTKPYAMKTICVLLVLRTLLLCVAAPEDGAESSAKATEGAREGAGARACEKGRKGVQTARRFGPRDPPINLGPIYEFQRMYNEHMSQMKKYHDDLADHMKEQTDLVAQHGKDLKYRLDDHFNNGHRTYRSGSNGDTSRKISHNTSNPQIVDGFNDRPKVYSVVSTYHSSNVNGQPTDKAGTIVNDNDITTRHEAKTSQQVVAESFKEAARKGGEKDEQGGTRIYYFQTVYNDHIPDMKQYQSHDATRMNDEANRLSQHGSELINRLLAHFLSQHKTFVASVPSRKTSENIGDANIVDNFNDAGGGAGGDVQPKFDSVPHTNRSEITNGLATTEPETIVHNKGNITSNRAEEPQS